MHRFTEKVWIQMFRMIGTMFSLPEAKHAACIKLISLQCCVPLYQLYAISGVMETTVQQKSPLFCYRRICEIQGTQGHTEHVLLSSSRLYAPKACHFRGSVLL